MKNFSDLISSIVVAVLAWLVYNYFGAVWALVVLVAATVAFIWWSARKGRDQDE